MKLGHGAHRDQKFSPNEGPLSTQHTLVGIPTEQNEMQADAREAAATPGAWLRMRAWPGTAGTAMAVQS